MIQFIFFILSVFTVFSSFSQDFNKYLMFKSVIDSSDYFIDINNFHKAEVVLKSIDNKSLPLDFKRTYYCNLTEIAIVNNKQSDALSYFKLAVLNGTKNIYIQYLEKKYTDTTSKLIINNLKEKYNAIINDYNSNIDSLLLKICNNMYSNDQSIRFTYSNILNQNTKQFRPDSILFIMSKTDSANISVYDSIVNSIGWLYREKCGHSLKNYHIIVAHAESFYRYNYVKRGFELAKNAKIEWSEIIGIQTFAFTKSELEIGKVRYIENFIINNQDELDSEFNSFIMYCLFRDLTDGGLYNGKTKKIKLHLNIKSDHEKEQILQAICKRVRLFNSSVYLNIEYSMNDIEIVPGIKKGTVGIEYF